jgi:VCBS repeat-containing protein
MKAKTITATILIAVFLISAMASMPMVSAPGPKKADLSITKIGSKSSACVGDTITYTYTVHNAGPDKAQHPVQVIDDKLGTFTYMDNKGNPIDLDKGDTWTFTVTVLVNDTGTLVNMAIVVSNTNDPNMDNNVIIWSIHILPPTTRCIYWHMRLTTNSPFFLFY